MAVTHSSVDAVVIGAGVVGLAVARALARSGHDTVVIERESTVGAHQSSRNSEVIHAGVYYPPASLKARLCLAGQRRLTEYCDAHGVAYRRCGKLIVATHPREEAILQALVGNAEACGLLDLERLTGAAARALEPELWCTEAVLSPSSGIVDSAGLMAALLNDAEQAGAAVALQTEVLAVREHEDGGLGVVTHDHHVHAQTVVNAAGLGATAIASTIRTAGGASLDVPAQFLCKGTYFAVAGRPFERLVYPVPDTASLGIHATVDLAGAVRLGPDQQWVDTVEYTPDPTRAPAFVAAAQRYFPALRPDALRPAYAGVRTKLQGPGAPAADFVVRGPQAHGIAGLVNLLGIESPGLTSALALADEVLARLGLAPCPDA